MSWLNQFFTEALPSPQVAAASVRALIATVWAMVAGTAAIVLVEGASWTQAATYTILVAAVGLAPARTFEGFRDWKRNKNGDIRPSDVGAYSAPLEK